MEVVTCIAPVNIATIKYWGKRDESLILPLNDSLSATLSTDDMHARTTVTISPDFKDDQMWLNGKEQDMKNPRITRCLKEIRKCASVKNKDLANCKVHITSKNNFPTAAGLASSAAGYACLVYSLSKAYKVDVDVSKIARLGSGSACRSVYGGFVQWHAGISTDGADSIAEQLYPHDHWPELRILILVVNDTMKKIGSSSGMQQSVMTSELLKHRIKESVPKNIKAMIKAIGDKNFDLFADITMKESNQMHAVCLDTYPPIVYMNDVSHAIVDFVHNYNKLARGTKIAYTFDAGPNACLFLLEKDLKDVIAHIIHTFPPASETDDYVRGYSLDLNEIIRDTPAYGSPNEPGFLKYIISTKVGEGPKVVSNDCSN